MTEFNSLVRYMAKAFAAGQAFGERAATRHPVAPVTTPAPAWVAAAFQAYMPNYYTPVGLRTARLDKVEMFNGRPTAYYSMMYFNPAIGRNERRAWRYVLKGGVPTEDKAFPVSFR